MISKHTPMIEAIRQLALLPESSQERHQENILAALRNRRNGERLVQAIREQVGELEAGVLHGFDHGSEDEQVRDFCKAVLLLDGRETTVTVLPN